MATGFKSGPGIYLLGSGEVADQAKCLWRKAGLRIQQQQESGRWAGLCTVSCSTSGRGKQFARRSKGTGPNAGVGKLSQKDVLLVEHLQKFIASENLPPNQLPSIKQLTSKGRADLANAVRSRGYRAVSRMLASYKPPTETTSSSSDIEIADSAGCELRAESASLELGVNLLVEVVPALDASGSKQGASTEEAEDDRCLLDEASDVNGRTVEQSAASDQAIESEEASSSAASTLPDVTVGPASPGTDGAGETNETQASKEQLPNAQQDAASPVEDEGGPSIPSPLPVAALKQRLARLSEAVTELSFHDRAKMYVETGDSRFIKDSSSSERVSGWARMDSIIGDLRESAGLGRTQQMDEVPSETDVSQSSKDQNQPDSRLQELPPAQVDTTIAAESASSRESPPPQPAPLPAEKVPSQIEAETERPFDEVFEVSMETGELRLLRQPNSSAPSKGWSRLDLDDIFANMEKSAGLGRLQQTDEILSRADGLSRVEDALGPDSRQQESLSEQPEAENAPEREDSSEILPPQPAGLPEERPTETELSIQERARMFMETGDYRFLQQPIVTKPTEGWARPDFQPTEPSESVDQGRIQQIEENLTEAGDVQWVKDSNYSDPGLQTLLNAQSRGANVADNEGDPVVPAPEPVGLPEDEDAPPKAANAENSFRERTNIMDSGYSRSLQEPSSLKPADGWARLDALLGNLRKSVGQGRLQHTYGILSTADDTQSPEDSSYSDSGPQAEKSKNFSSTKQWDDSKESDSSSGALLTSVSKLQRGPMLSKSEEPTSLPQFGPSGDVELLGTREEDDFDDTDFDFLDEEDEALTQFLEIQGDTATGRDLGDDLSYKGVVNRNYSWKSSEQGLAVLEREGTVAGEEEADQILSILAKQREIGRLMQRDQEIDAQFRADAQAELEKIKSLLQAREAKMANLRQALLETQEELSLLKAKSAADLKDASQRLAEKDAVLKSAQLALTRLRKVCLEWWGEGTKVELAGSFNGWQHFFVLEPDFTSEIPHFDGSRGPMLWGLDVWLYPGVYEIKFIVDGIWTVDHRREMVMRSSTMQNNLLRVDA